MSAFDPFPDPSTGKKQARNFSLPLSGLVTQLSPLEQLSFPDVDPTSNVIPTLPFYISEPAAPPQEPASPAIVTGTLADAMAFSTTVQQPWEQTGSLSFSLRTSSSLSSRQPVHIRGSRKHTPPGLPAPSRPMTRGRRLWLHLGVIVLSLFVLLSILSMVLPVGSDAHSGLFTPILSLLKTHSNNTALIAAQAATATAVTQDGFDPGGGRVYAGVSTGPGNSPDSSTGAGNSSGSSLAPDIGRLARFFYGQCTYWANMHYHDLTGHWVPWLGNAYQWSYAASSYGWVVSDLPNLNGPSIIVLQPYVQQAGYYGHVAIVEHTNSDGSVLTSNWNWAGDWARKSYVTFTPGPGVKFLWYPS